MSHPLVDQLRFTRSEWVRGLEGVTAEEAARRFEPMNSIAWLIGHLAWQEQAYWLQRAQGRTVSPVAEALRLRPARHHAAAGRGLGGLARGHGRRRRLSRLPDDRLAPGQVGAGADVGDPGDEAAAHHLPLLVPPGRGPGDPPAPRPHRAAQLRRRHLQGALPFRALKGCAPTRGSRETAAPGQGAAQGRASRTRLNGVAAARRTRVNPPSVATCRRRASPAWAPRARPTSWDREFGVHSIVEAP